MNNIKYSINIDELNVDNFESNESGVITSDFFDGVSDKKYISLYEKLKQITTIVSTYFKLTKIEYNIVDFNIISIETNSYYPSDKLLSIILDNFDLNSEEEINKNDLFLNVI